MGDRNQNQKGQARIKRLPVADYVMGNWGIEAKEINDLYRSIIGSGRNGRTIVNQLQELELAYERPMLVIYGTQLKPWVAGGRPTAKRIAIERQRMEKVISAFKVTFFQRFPNIQIMQLKTMNDFVDWLAQNHTHLNIRGKISPIPHEIQKTPNRGDLHPQVAALSALSGITPETAERILDKFGGLRNVLRLRTTQKDLMQIEGVGRVKAKLILTLRDGWSNEQT